MSNESFLSVLKFLFNETWQNYATSTAQKKKFSIKDFSSKCDQTADLVTFTGEILNAKLHFLVFNGKKILSKFSSHGTLSNVQCYTLGIVKCDIIK